MFSSRKKPDPPKRRNHDLSQFGLMEIPDDFDPTVGLGDDVGDSDLEAELAAIAGGGGGSKPKPKPKPALVPSNDLDRMIADSLRDVGSDDDGDADLENDEDLMGELKNIAGSDGEMEIQPAEVVPKTSSEDNGTAEQPPEEPQMFLPTTTVDIIGVIQQRIEMYKQAEANAKAAGENGKARRFGRGLKTLTDQLKQASAGKSINVDDIPPEVSVKAATAPQTPTSDGSGSGSAPTTASPVSDNTPPPAIPTRTAPSPPKQKSADEESSKPVDDVATKTSADDEKPTNALIEQMQTRQREYKAAALQSKREGDTAMALQFLKVVKQFDLVMKMMEDGKEVDLSDMPPPPDQFKDFLVQMQAAAAAGNQSNTEEEASPPAPPQREVQAAEAPTSMLEALQQRLDKYKSVEEAAKAEENTSKARRFGRIVKQYEDAIKQHKSGRPVPYDELPVPPGFGPLPGEGAAAAAAGNQPPSKEPSLPQSPAATTAAAGSASSSSATTPTATPSPSQRKRTPHHHQDLTTRTSGNQQKNNLAEQQMQILLDRQKEFKIAAIEAKKSGEIEQAKEYLKIYKGFDSLLNAASSGLPVDLNTLPLPPSQRENLEESFAIIGTEEPDPDEEDISDIGVRMEEQLVKQLMMCKNTRDHHKAMGDVPGMNRFENLAMTVQKDLDLVRYSKRKNYTLPKFHYEKRSFNIVHCNTDLTDSELEIIVVRGMSYKCSNPKEIDTYVKIEFPLLNEEVFRAKTNLVKDTDSPEYDQHYKVEIQRGNRQFQRIFKRHGVKFEVYSRGGFLRSDILLGTVNVKLQPLETKCDIHDTFDLMEGRKQVGGKLEIKVRVRNPILTKQIEHLNEKWLVLDS